MQKITANDPESKSPDLIGENISRLQSLFPEVFTEGRVDFEVLKQLLGGAVDEREEKYGLNWHGKRRARQIALTPSTGTLRPCPAKSVDWDATQNLMIEGDNLEVLKLLQKSYSGRVKLIYIDPPYNTGNNFIYSDDFTDNIANYLMLTGQLDSDGRRISTNADSSGRFHTSWLSMMYPRLKLARSLMRDDGVIFVSLDDCEVASLRKLCDEVFGEENFVATLIWQKVFSPKNTARYFSEDHDYVICYAKNKEIWTPNLLPRSEEAVARYANPDNDPRGNWSSSDLTARNYYGDGQYAVTGPTGKSFSPGKGSYWRHSSERFQELDADGRIWWGEDKANMPRLKRFLSEVKDGVVPQTLLLHTLVGNTQEAKKELLEHVHFDETENVLNSVKPTRLIRHLIKIGTSPNSNDIVLDFFAGSGSTGHATLDQNLEDNGDRRFILVQIQEKLPKEEQFVKSIADLASSRLRNVGKRIKTTMEQRKVESQGALPGVKPLSKTIDVGFRIFKLDSSNIRAWAPDRDDLTGTLLDSVEHIRPDRSEQDILFELLLKLGLDLTVPIEEKTIAGMTVHSIGVGTLIVCLAPEISREDVEPLAHGIVAWRNELAPTNADKQARETRVVFRDSAFADDVAKTNLTAILHQHGLGNVRSL